MSSLKTRVLEDSQGRRAAFEDIQIGQSLGEMEWQITDDLIDLQCQLDQDFDPLFFPQVEGARIAPPQITYRPPRWLFSRAYNVRGLFVRWESETFRPIEANTTITVSGSVVEKFVKKDREFVVYQAEGKDRNGNLIFRTRRTHVLDFVERSAPREGAGIDSGIKPEKI
ncbi:MAG: MaoC family dehydratase [Burkholderiales bacterium]